ncbi:hypothetical protein [Janthinobacterium sp. B9-8]|uniref:hypothetical protein n=1 Tax=Janthinobacterium sp. B9-8 TaxID=1236179 RepID=UPI00061CE0C5|nr:hypothetical protein [Janthinobacterium sp. B9-8]AMC36233.1 hypothetical protein VN23_17375 [Janthinobacterium sp. B9-8]
MTAFTTHLICVPELADSACVSALHIAPGHHVQNNAPLLTLSYGSEEIEICAPEAGLVSHLMVSLTETVFCGDLLLQMEIEETPEPVFGAEATFVSACQVDWPETAVLSVSPQAAQFAARLGVDLSAVEAQGKCIEITDVEAHIRSVMLQWQAANHH